jgi:hypothetical protein
MTPSGTLVVVVMAAITVGEMDHGQISAHERMKLQKGMNEVAYTLPNLGGLCARMNIKGTKGTMQRVLIPSTDTSNISVISTSLNTFTKFQERKIN